MRTGFLTAIVVWAPLAVLVGQQDGQLLHPGASVRVSHTYVCNTTAAGANSCGVASSGAATKATGTLLRLDADTLALTLGGAETLVLPRTSITKLEVSRGRKSRTGAWVGYGALVGAGTGAVASLIGCGIASSSGGSGCHTFGEDPYGDATASVVAASAVLGTVVGGVVGGVIGAKHPRELWEEVPSNHWRLSAAPQLHGGFALNLSVAF